MRVRRSGLALGLGLGLLASPAIAAPSARLAYVREPGAERCADEEGLRRAVAARLGYDPFFPWAKVTVVAHVRKEPSGYRAEVMLVDEHGVSRGARTIAAAGDDCVPLVGALALTISLALDPLSLGEAPAPKAPPPPPPTPPPAPVEPPPSPADRRDELAPAPEPPPAPTANASPWRGWLGVAAGARYGVTPGVASGALARLAIARDRFALAIEAGADFPTESSVAGGGAVRAWVAQGALLGCVRVSVFSGCGLVSAGPLVASGVGLVTPESHVLAYGLAGPRVALTWPVSPRFVLEGFAEVGFALARRELEVDGRPVYLQPVAAPRLGLGVATRIF